MKTWKLTSEILSAQELFRFVFKELLFIIMPIIVLIIVKCGFLNSSLVDVFSLSNFAFANVVLTSIVISNYIKVIVEIKRAKKYFFYAGINFLIFLLIITVLFLAVILLKESGDSTLKFEDKTIALLNVLMFIFSSTFLFNANKRLKSYHNSVFDKKLSSNPIIAYEYLVDKLKEINSTQNDVIRILTESKITPIEKNTNNLRRLKTKESFALSKGIIDQIEDNLSQMKSEFDKKYNYLK